MNPLPLPQPPAPETSNTREQKPGPGELAPLDAVQPLAETVADEGGRHHLWAADHGFTLKYLPGGLLFYPCGGMGVRHPPKRGKEYIGRGGVLGDPQKRNEKVKHYGFCT